VSRRGLLGAAAGALTLAATPSWAAAPALLTGKGDIRKVNFYSKRLGESINAVYWIEGEYIPEVMAEISHVLRDWREGVAINYDRRAIDVIAAAHKLLETSEPYEILSGYRSRRTNEMLRRKSRGVAKDSYHMKGMAVDVKLKSRSVGQMFRAASACSAGGVGRYSRSNFVHMDCGPVRTWGR
jgi:uncharacterized protein YcbK (DUF882 family)